MNPSAEDLPVGNGVVVPAAELKETFVRASGPGGQHVNTSATKVQLRFDVAASSALTAEQKERIRQRLGSRMTAEGELLVDEASERSQTRNRWAARRRLATLLSDALAPRKRRRATRPSAAARRRRVQNKRRRGEIKELRRRPET